MEKTSLPVIKRLAISENLNTTVIIQLLCFLREGLGRFPSPEENRYGTVEIRRQRVAASDLKKRRGRRRNRKETQAHLYLSLLRDSLTRIEERAEVGAKVRRW